MNKGESESECAKPCRTCVEIHTRLGAAVQTLERVQTDHIHKHVGLEEIIWKGIGLKMDSGTFRWLVGILVVVLLAFASFQWGTYITVAEVKSTIIELKSRMEESRQTDNKIIEALREVNKK